MTATERDRAYLKTAADARKRMLSTAAEFGDAVRDAHRAGWSVREIASAVDLSSSRVHQMLHDRTTVRP